MIFWQIGQFIHQIQNKTLSYTHASDVRMAVISAGASGGPSNKEMHSDYLRVDKINH